MCVATCMDVDGPKPTRIVGHKLICDTVTICAIAATTARELFEDDIPVGRLCRHVLLGLQRESESQNSQKEKRNFFHFVLILMLMTDFSATKIHINKKCATIVTHFFEDNRKTFYLEAFDDSNPAVLVGLSAILDTTEFVVQLEAPRTRFAIAELVGLAVFGIVDA